MAVFLVWDRASKNTWDIQRDGAVLVTSMGLWYCRGGAGYEVTQLGPGQKTRHWRLACQLNLWDGKRSETFSNKPAFSQSENFYWVWLH